MTAIVLPIAEVGVPVERHRGIDPMSVRRLLESIREVGLLHPITVTRDNVLVSGLHRLAACELLGWTTIPATVVDLDGMRAELAELDENLVRNELSALERAEHLARRKEIYEALHPETRAGVAGGKASGAARGTTADSAAVRSFVSDTAAKTGVSERTIREDVALARDLAPDVREALRGTDVADNKSALRALADESADRQRELAAAGPEVVREAAKAKRKKTTSKETRKDGPPCDGMQFARMAILDLEQIRDDDEEREQAFNHVQAWIKGAMR